MSQTRSNADTVLLSLAISGAACAAGLYSMGRMQAMSSTRFELRIVLILSEVALALPALLGMALLASRMPELFRFRRPKDWTIPLTFALGIALWTLSLGVFEAQYVLVRPPIEYLNQFQGLHEQLRPKSILGWAFSIGAIAVAPAICEEIVFRGLLAPVIRNIAGYTAAIVSSAGLFGLIHIDSVQIAGGPPTMVFYRVPFAFVLGLLLAKIRIDTGSLWPPMIAHATLNATTFIVVFLVPEQKGVMPDPQPLVALGMLLLGGFASSLLLRRIRTTDVPAAA